MKRKLLIASAFLLSLSYANAQGVMDAYKYSQTELTGTARSMSMGGAFGALGGDVTAISINPAGIGVYKSSEIVTTLNMQNRDMKAETNAGTFKEKKFRVNFNNLAFVAAIPIYSEVAPTFNVGFSYNRLKSFDREYSAVSNINNRSLADYIADRTTGNQEAFGGYRPNDLLLTSANENGLWRDKDWLSVLGYNSFLISEDSPGKYSSTTAKMRAGSDLFVRERGSVNSYDFNFGTTFADMISAGISLSVTDMNYKMFSSYIEDFESNGKRGDFDLQNVLETEGTGWQVGVGVIFKPIQELRIGVGYHSPTWYNMTDHYGAEVFDNFNNLKGEMSIDRPYDGNNSTSSYAGEWAVTDYRLRTPDKWTFSMAGVLGANAIISIDYELTDYKKMKLNDRNGYGIDGGWVNEDIKAVYKLASMLRVGGEYRFTPQLSGRIGYAWQQSPYEKFMDNNVEEVHTAGAIPHFIVDGDTNYFTWGLGYRFTRSFYSDVAFVIKNQNATLYAFDGAEKVDLKHNGFQGALTLGYRF